VLKLPDFFRLTVGSPLFLVRGVLLVKLSEGFVSVFLSVFTGVVSGCPASNRLDCDLEILDVAHVHLGYLPMNFHDTTRFVIVVVVLAENRPSCLLEARVCMGQRCLNHN